MDSSGKAIECAIVTCYYRFAKSKHPDIAYDTWMYNMLSTIETPVVVFCDETMKEQIIAMRNNKPLMVLIKPLMSAKCATFMEYWHKDKGRDKEGFLHAIEHYIIWNEKVNFVSTAMKFIKAHKYCWCDIGCFRSASNISNFRNWPVGRYMSAQMTPNKIYITCVESFQSTDFETDPITGMTRSFEGDIRLSAAILIGCKRSWKRMQSRYYAMLDEYMKHDMFAGVDQNILASLVVRHPDMFQLVSPNMHQGDPWFFLQRLFC
jgi:hypothetical protein